MPRPVTMSRRLLYAASALLLSSCAARVSDTGDYVTPAAQGGAALPRPGEVLVQDFAVDWQNVQLDQGLRARLQRQGGNPPQDQQAIAAEVQAAIADTLVEQISAMGLHAVRAAPGTRTRPGDVIVAGQIVKVNGGNATRRNLIGFGAGKSEVYADVQVEQVARGGATRLLQTYSADANSGRTPGLGVGAASAAGGQVALAATGAVVGTTMRARQGLPKDGENLGRRVASNLGTFFTRQGWIAPSSGQ